MGRNKKANNGVYDRIGEAVDLALCPCCSAHMDCFANMEGKCTALKDCGEQEGQGCVFYKPFDVAMAEARESYKKLKEGRRFDLIQKHSKVFMALGVFDDEIDDADEIEMQMEAFREANLKELIEKDLAEASVEEKEAEHGTPDHDSWTDSVE